MYNIEVKEKLMKLKNDLNIRIATKCSEYWNDLDISNTNMIIDIKSVDDVISILSEKAKFIENELINDITIESRTDTFISIYVLMRIVVESYLNVLIKYDISDDNIYSVINLINFRLVALNAYDNNVCDTTTFIKGIETAYLSILRIFIATVSALLYGKKAFDGWDYIISNNKPNKQLELIISDSTKFNIADILDVIYKLGLSYMIIRDVSDKFKKVNNNIEIKPSSIKFDDSIGLDDSNLLDIRKNMVSEFIQNMDTIVKTPPVDDTVLKINKIQLLINDIIDTKKDFYLRVCESILSKNSLRINDEIDKLSKKTIYCIVGESGSGKDSLVRYTIDKYKLDPEFRPIVSFTDRPKRDNETDGVQHHFISSSEFDDITMNKEVIAYTKIGKYRYMTIKDNFNNGNIYVIDPKGLKDFKRDYDDKYDIVTIYIDTPYKVRKQRVSERSDSDKFMDRSKSEKQMFDDFRKYRDYDYIIDNGDLTSMDDASMILVKILTK